MKHFNKIAVCLAGGLALNAGLRADTAPTAGNPYALVVARNIFGLNPPAPPEAPAPPPEPPVKIMLNGIMDVFGKVQALFKVAGRTPGKEESYMLTEGQGQDDIEVVKIDEKNGMVTFNNHGLQQMIPLAAAPSSTLPAATAATTAVPGRSGMPGIPGAATAGAFGNSGFSAAFGSRGATVVSTPATVNAAANAGNVRPVPIRKNFDASSQIPEGMTPEVQTIAIEVNRELTKQKVISGDLPPLPVTELTPSDAVGPGGAPLVTPTPAAP